jgi:hypothetical protein
MPDFFLIPAEENAPKCLINPLCVEFVNWGEFEVRLHFISGKNIVLSGDRAKAFIEQCGHGAHKVLLTSMPLTLDELLED